MWTLSDASGFSPHTDSPTFAGTPFSQGTVYDVAANPGLGSLLNVRQNLQILADSINANAQDADGQPVWNASLQGYRLVLRPLFGDKNSDATATLVSDGAYDLGADAQFFDPTPSTANVLSYSLGTTGSGDFQGPGMNGTPGGIPSSQDYQAAFNGIDRDVDIFNLLILPRAAGQSDPQREALWGLASNFCLNRRAFLLVDPRSTWETVNDVDSEITQLRNGVVKDHAAIYWPRVQIPNIGGGLRTIDPSGSMAGVMARTDSNRGVWKAPAGLEADLRGVRALEHSMSDPENGIINPEAVNAIRSFPTGIVSWGARTMDGSNDNANADYRYVPVRRIALFIEESLFRGLKFAVFEPNDEPLWAQIRLAAGAFMNNLFRQGAFQGQKARDAYFVKVDSETTTQNDINLGIVNVVVGFAPLRPAEFVIITLQQMAGQVQT
ncbi:phage tail sheath family protein [Leptolyngbya cf. ectocarpi LEGE 11479]|uniref:Phage tail sheath family protein n=2 Tax=Leptolyngbya ectocarpi TaxID=1202 RepID=A0A928ZRE8_LEPEC|nr:phage tail sheath family protein [Leptolyngbya cf. ectocarpi LEGE 11479]